MTRNIRALAWLLLTLSACDPRPVDYVPVALDPCGRVVDVALQKQVLQLLIGGGMNEKLDQKVAPANSLVSVVDAYRQKSGELRARNDWVQMTKLTESGASLASCRAMFPLPGGNLGLIGSVAAPSTADALYEYVPSQAKWIHNYRGYQPMPMAVTTLAPLQSQGLATAASISNVLDPDIAISGNLEMEAMVDAAGNLGYVITDVSTGAIIQGFSLAPVQAATYRVASGGIYLALFVVDTTAFPNTIRATVYNTSTGAVNTYAVSGAVGAGGNRAIDVQTKAGGSTILVAYALNAGGVQLVDFDPSTGTAAHGPTTIATGGAVSAVGWLQDSFATGFSYLSYSDSVNGLATKRFNVAFAASLTVVADATKTASASITGFLATSGPTFTVISNNATGNTDSNATTLILGLVPISKVFLIGSKYYILAFWNSTVQPTAFVIPADTSTQDLVGARIAGIIMPGTAGGLQSSTLLSSVVVSGTKALTALLHVTKQTNTFFSTTKQALRATINFSPSLRNARELSGTMFFPGGMVTQFDGTTVDLATFPLAPEIRSASTAAGGSMTPSGVYQYVAVYRGVDANGRLKRSAPSIPFKVTLGAGDHSALITATTATIGPIAGVTDPAIEFYRAGPAAAGGIVYNKTGEIASTTAATTAVFTDTLADGPPGGAAAGELLYDPLANSGVLNNFPSPSTQLLEVLDNRVFVVSAENPFEVWPSKEYKSGAGLAFNPGLVQRFTGSPITALAAMDGRLVVFQGASTWVWPIGAGPNDNGQGTFGDPQLVSLNIGCIDPDSVVATPDGIVFAAKQGIYLLTRGLDMQYIGAAVEDGAAAFTSTYSGFAGASLADGTNQARFIANTPQTVSGPLAALVYDYSFQQWYEWNLPSSGAAMVGMVTVGGQSYYVDSTGQAWQETTSPATSISWSFKLPALAVGQLGGWFLTYELQVIGTYEGPHVLAVSLEPSYSPSLAVSGNRSIVTAPPSYQFAFRPRRQKAGSMQPRVVITPNGANEGARISALSLVYGAKGGRYPLAPSRRLA